MKQNHNPEKLRRGSLSLILSIAVVALVIVLNVVLTALSGLYGGFSIDMTSDDLFSVSDDTVAQLDGTAQQTYTIYFCKPLDQLNQNSYSQLVYSCAKEFAAKMENVKVDYLDIYKYPGLAEKYKRSASDTVLSSDVIVETETACIANMRWTLSLCMIPKTPQSSMPSTANSNSPPLFCSLPGFIIPLLPSPSVTAKRSRRL